jgi:hypothetical protein
MAEVTAAQIDRKKEALDKKKEQLAALEKEVMEQARAIEADVKQFVKSLGLNGATTKTKRTRMSKEDAAQMKTAVKEWRTKNKDGSRKDAADHFNISYQTMGKYWK